MIRSVHSHKQRIDSVFALVSKGNYDPEILAHWAQYLCVLVAGYLEQSVTAVYTEFVDGKAHPYVLSYAGKTLGSFQNPKMGKIIELTRQFNSSWADALECDSQGELKDAVDTIMTNRHKIAHGRPVPELTFSRVQEYYRAIVQVTELLSTQCGL